MFCKPFFGYDPLFSRKTKSANALVHECILRHGLSVLVALVLFGLWTEVLKE